MKLLVGSVFASGEQQQIDWFNLQRDFLDLTTPDYDHCIYVAHPDVSAFKGKSLVVGNRQSDPSQIHCSVLHLEGLRCLHHYFLTQLGNYDAFLFLDSDAFPVQKNWMTKLVRSMCEQRTKRDCAAIVRTELCEMRYHASVLFLLPQALADLEFLFGEMRGLEGQDLLGYQENDIHINYQYAPDRHRVLPLLRTNQYNVHPVACGIYYDMFYHHAFGSEHGIKVDTEPFKSLRHVGKHSYGLGWSGGHYDFRSLYNRIMTMPGEFVEKLAGWSDNYACPTRRL